MENEKLPPIHPGEILALDFLAEMGLTANALAIAVGVPANRIQAIVKGKRAITADTALRLGKYFGTTARFWMNLQAKYDLDVTADAIQDQLASIRPRPGEARSA